MLSVERVSLLCVSVQAENAGSQHCRGCCLCWYPKVFLEQTMLFLFLSVLIYSHIYSAISTRLQQKLISGFD